MPSDNFSMSENSGSFGMQQRQDRFAAIGDLIVGPPGPPGPVGADGKSAYEQAVEGGYQGTEEEFNEELAAYAELSEDVAELQSAFNAAIVPTTNLITLINLQTGKIVNARGTVVDNAQYSLSDFIPVEPSTEYYTKGVVYYAQYNAEKTFIVRTSATSTGGVITTRNTAAYVRAMSNKAVSGWQLNLGDDDLGYQTPDVQYLGDDVVIGKQLEATTFGLDLVTPQYTVPFIPSMPYHYTGDSIIPYKNGGHLSELYALYDNLVATYPQYCRKSVLGLDASGNYELRRYTIDNGTNYAYRYPRLVWLAGIHGNEGNSITTTYHMAKELLSKFATDPSCFGILSAYRVIIVPVVNPWGFENYSRLNSNNVNLNRNFPADWIYRDPTLAYGETKYGIMSASNGSNPYYYYGGGTVVYDDSTQTATTTYVAEPETQLIMDMINSNNTGANLNGKIAFAVNKHDAGPMSQEGATILIRDNFTYDREFLTDLCMWLKTQLMATQNWLTEKTGLNLSTVWYDLANDPASAGTMDKWLNAIGIHGCLLEIPKEAGSSYADTEHYADLCTINVDVGINLMMNTIVNNSKLKIATQTENYTIVT